MISLSLSRPQGSSRVSNSIYSKYRWLLVCGFQAPEYTLVARTDHRVTWDHLLVLYGVFVARPQPEHGSRPPHCRSLWVGTSIIIQMSGSQIIKLRKMCVHWAMITWVPRRPRRPPRDAAVCRCHSPPGDRWNIQ